MRIIFLSLLTVCCLPASAQVSVGVIGGYSHATLQVSDRLSGPPSDILQMPPPESKYAPRWHIGLIADLHLGKGFYVQPQILVSKKGDKSKLKGSNAAIDYEGTFKTSLTYLEFPVNLLYKVPFGKGKVVMGAGAYCARALNGKYVDRGSARAADGSYSNQFVSQGKIRFDNKMPSQPEGLYYYKKSDQGLNFIAGYELKNGLILNVNYSLGLTDVYTYDPETRKNTYFGLSAGYLLKIR